MPRFIALLTLVGASVTLTGCSVFYPNWGATSLPDPTQSVSETPTATPTDTASSEPTATATDSASATPSPTETAAIKRKEVDVEIIMATPEPDYGSLTVVAQIPTLSESGGKCIFKFIGGSTEKTMEVKAEPSSDYTQCYPIEFPLDQLPSGNGVVTVSYESDTHFGVSAPVSVVIN